MLLTHPTRGVFTLPVHETSNRIMYRDPWIGSPSMEYAPPSDSTGRVQHILQSANVNSCTLAFTSHTPDPYLNSKRIKCQLRTGKIGLRHFLCLRKVPGFNDPRCTCRNDNQTVRHILQDCPLYHDLRSTTWAEERRKEPGGVIEWRKMLSHPPFAQKAAQFMLKTGLLGQFEDLRGEPMRL